jgi:hypothetical protein
MPAVWVSMLYIALQRGKEKFPNVINGVMLNFCNVLVKTDLKIVFAQTA